MPDSARERVVARLADHLAATRLGHPTRVAVDGVTAAGKTTMADELAVAVAARGRPTIRLSMDGFHHPRAHRHRLGRDSAEGYYRDAYDLDRFADLVLRPLGVGGDGRYRRRIIDLATDESIDEAPVPAAADAVLIVDGTFLQREELAGLWDEVVYLDVELAAAKARGSRRDADVFGGQAAAERAFESRYHAACQIYLDEVDPARRATIVVDNTDLESPVVQRMPTVEARSRRGVPVIAWPAFDEQPVEVIVTTREGGRSAGPYDSLNLGLHVGDDEASVLANREIAASALGTGLDDLVFAEQVHRAHVEVVTAADRGRGSRSAGTALPGTDALVTTDPGVVLVMMVADCVPLVLFDPVRRVLACVHAGWPGTVRGVTPAAVSAMASLGSDPADLIVGIGPSIAPDRYQVREDVVTAVRAAMPEWADEVVRPDGTGAWTFDLWGANTRQLLACGVRPDRVHVAGLDTGPGTPFFSHRSEGPCGRFAVLARITEAVG